MQPNTPPTNPYVTQQPDYDQRAQLKEVAAGQRQVLLCVLGQLVTIGLRVAQVQTGSLLLLGALIVVALPVFILMVMSVLKLANALQLPSPGVYVGLMFIPCVSFVFLLILTGKATKKLSAAGHKVGLLGINPNII